MYTSIIPVIDSLYPWKFAYKLGSGETRTHASEETGALNQRLTPLGPATGYARIIISNQFALNHQKFFVEVDFESKKQES